MLRKKNNVVYVDFIFRRKKLKSKFMIFLYSLYLKIRKLFFKPSLKGFHSKLTTSTKQKSSNY